MDCAAEMVIFSLLRHTFGVVYSELVFSPSFYFSLSLFPLSFHFSYARCLFLSTKKQNTSLFLGQMFFGGEWLTGDLICIFPFKNAKDLPPPKKVWWWVESRVREWEVVYFFLLCMYVCVCAVAVVAFPFPTFVCILFCCFLCWVIKMFVVFTLNL